MNSQPQIEITLHSSIEEVGPKDWDACACPEASDGGAPFDPFTTYRFLHALEQSGSVGSGTGWTPRPMAARKNGEVIAVAPLYVKGHSQGEYVFDHAWANAYQQAGGAYYPKLQLAVPFTPATGRRLLVRQGHKVEGQSALVQGAVQIAANNQLSSIHITFCEDEEVEAGVEMGLMHRVGQQFHWYNKGYRNFDAFTADLSSRKRKAIRRERRIAAEFGGTIERLTGDQIEPEHWDAFWQFYQDTGARKWGSPYLTRAFFDEVQAQLRNDVMLVFAFKGGRPIAGALNFIGRDCLYGRYWGCIEHHDCLHFELCYYQAIDVAIERGLGRVEAGAQGDHKIARGYMPVTTNSLHWIGEPGFKVAVQEYLEAERDAVVRENSYLTDFGPFKHVDVEEQS